MSGRERVKDNKLRLKHLFLYTVFRGVTTLQQDK